MNAPSVPHGPREAGDRAGEAHRALRAYVSRTYREHFGVTDEAQAEAVTQDWLNADARHDARFADLARLMPEARRVLDLASGLGTATLRGLALGLDAYGLEPDAEKLALMRPGLRDVATAARFARAVGERLPYKDGSFDAILSYQTLEHVQDLDAVLAEMLRAVKTGGALHLRCPDYRGTFEGHYLVAWLPLMPRPLARAYLRLRGRPTEGLRGIVYTTRARILRSLRTSAARAGLTLQVVDLERERLRERLKDKGLPSSTVCVRVLEAALYLRRAFRADSQVNLWVVKRS